MQHFGLFILLLIGSTLTDAKNPRRDKTVERRVAHLSSESCSYKFPNHTLKTFFAGYLDEPEDQTTEVDTIFANFGDIFTKRKCNKKDILFPELQIKEVGKGTWNDTDPIWRREHLFENRNPCAAYELRVEEGDKPVGNFTVGPYYENRTIVYPEIDEDNEEYKKNLSGNAVKTKPEAISVKITIGPVCAKMLEVSITEPDSDKEEEVKTRRRSLLEIDPKEMKENVITMEDLEPCTKYVVNIALSLKNQNTESFVKDEKRYKRDKITSFTTTPNVELLKEARFRQYDETTQLLSWNFSAFLDQPCALPLKNATFFLIIGNETAENVQKVRRFAAMISLLSFVICNSEKPIFP